MTIRLTFATAAFMLCMAASSQNRSIRFEHGTWKETLEKAKKEHKLVFVDAYTSWCGPCKQMARDVFTNDTAADFYNTNFINAKIDMEKGEGPELAKTYDVGCYPNLLFIDGDGKLVHRVAGSMPVQLFVEVGKRAKDDSKNFGWYVKNYEARKTDPAFMRDYISQLTGTCLDAEKELAHYFSMQSESDLWSDANWEMMRDYTSKLDSREFNFIVNNKAKLIAKYGEEAVNGKITVLAGDAIHAIIRSKHFDQQKYDQAREQIAALNMPSARMILFEAGLNLARQQENWKAFSEQALSGVDGFYANSADGLNSVAWDFYEQIDDKAALAKAEEWSKHSVELDPSYANLDTYAALLYKNGKKAEALTAANKAIETAKKEKYPAEEYKSTSELLVKIKAMK